MGFLGTKERRDENDTRKKEKKEDEGSRECGKTTVLSNFNRRRDYYDAGRLIRPLVSSLLLLGLPVFTDFFVK